MSKSALSNTCNLSVVISTFERAKYINQLLKSIKSQTLLPEEIILVDSSKAEMFYDIPDTLNVKLVKSDIAQLTYQRNIGVSFSNCEIILHIDDDVILDSDYIKNIIKCFNEDKRKKIDVVGGYILNEWNKTDFKNNIVVRLFKSLGLLKGNLVPGYFSGSGIFIELEGLKKNLGIYNTDFISGTSFAVRSKVYKKYNHPENINKYGGEDKVFSRMISKDFKMVINTNARLNHLFAQSGNRDSNYTSYNNTVRFNIYIQKKFPKTHSSTILLRTYYFLLGAKLISVGFLGFFVLVNVKKNISRIIKGFGYITGSMSIN